MSDQIKSVLPDIVKFALGPFVAFCMMFAVVRAQGDTSLNEINRLRDRQQLLDERQQRLEVTISSGFAQLMEKVQPIGRMDDRLRTIEKTMRAP